MTTTTQINITAKDSTAGAFASATQNLSTLSSSAVQTAASIAGVSLSFAGLAASIKSSINAADETFKLSQKIGVAVEQVAGLELAFKQSGLGADQLQSRISKLAKNVASGNSAFEAMGIATRGADGNLKSTRDILAEVADKFASYQDGISKTALAIQLFGKSGADVIPLLNQGAASLAEFDAMAQKLGLTLSKDTAQRAAQFNDTLSLVGQSFKGISTRVSAEMLPTLQGLAEQFFNTATQGNNISAMASGMSTALKGLVGVALGVAGAFKTVGTAIGGTAAAFAAFINGDFSQAATIVKQIKSDFSDNFKNTIDNVTKAWEANGSASVEALAATQKQVQIQAPLTSEIEKSTKAIEKQSTALKWQVGNLKELQDIYSRVQSITKGVETEQEKYNNTIEELNRLKPYLGAETYARALQKAQDELNKTTRVTKTTTDQVDQLWTQAGRNIQSTLANSIFNFFDDGLKGMLKNVAITIGRIVSEFAGLKIAQGVGLGAIFGGASGAANASGGGGGISSILNGASMASGAASLFKTGFGATSALGSVGGMLPGSTGAFFSGMGGGAVSGVSSPAALMGSTFASVAGPAIAIAAVDQITRMLVGDKKLGGTAGKVLNFVPVLGPLINGLFGRGPMKQGMTTLKGEVGAEGFESGRLQTRFDAKGGAFRSNKTDFATIDAVTGKISTDNGKLNAYAQSLSETSKQIIGLINDTTKQVSSSLYAMGKNLGLSTDGLDSFTHTIKLVSKAGKGLTEEQIGNEIAAITKELAYSLLPSIDDLAKNGESATDTLSRLNTEFVSLEAAAMNLGASSKYATELVKGMSFEARSSLIELAGGLESLASKTAFFAQNFFNESERLVPITENLKAGLEALGLSANITREQFKGLVQDVNISNELRNSLLDLAPAFVAVRSAQEKYAQDLARLAESNAAEQQRVMSDLQDKEEILLELRQKSVQEAINAAQAYKKLFDDNLSGAFSNVQKSADAEKNKLADEYNKKIKETDESISSISSTISKLSSLSGAIRGTVESIRGVSVTQAITNIKEAIKGFVNGGIIPKAEDLQGSLNALQNQSSSGFSTKLEFARAKAGNAALVEQLGSMVDSSISADESQLGALEAQRMELEQGFLNETARLDALVSEAQHQVNVLMGIDDKILSLVQSLGNFNLTSGGNVGGVGANGNPSITGSQISDFIDANASDPMAIYNAAKANGVSDYQITQTGKYTQAQIDDFISQNGLSPLDSYVPKTGNSSIAMGSPASGGQSSQQIKAMADDGRKTMEGINSMLTLLRRVTDNGSSLRTTAA